MGKKSQAKILLLEMYEDSIEEYVGASYVIDLVWGSGTSDRWTDRYNEKRKRKEDNNTVIAESAPKDFVVKVRTHPGWVKKESANGFYWEWDMNKQEEVNGLTTEWGRDGIYVNYSEDNLHPVWERVEEQK